MRTILFVCTGNTCRSPMAEAIARHALAAPPAGPAATPGPRPRRVAGRAAADEDVFVASAGIGAATGSPISREAVAALKRLGIEDQAGTSKPLTAAMIRNADVILCMTQAQVDAARDLVAGASAELAKIMPLDPQGDIEDPIGMGQAAYDAVARRMQRLIPRRLKEVLAHENRARL